MQNGGAAVSHGGTPEEGPDTQRSMVKDWLFSDSILFLNIAGPRETHGERFGIDIRKASLQRLRRALEERRERRRGISTTGRITAKLGRACLGVRSRYSLVGSIICALVAQLDRAQVS